MIQPPADLTASERRTYHKLVANLARAGVDVHKKGDLIVEYVRAGTRLAALREAEVQAEPARRFQAARAVNSASVERRRLHSALWAGARTQEREPTISERAREIAANEGGERWRAYFHRGDRTMSHDELMARYGHPGWGPLLYETAREEAACELYFERCAAAGRRRSPRYEDFVIEGEDDERANI